MYIEKGLRSLSSAHEKWGQKQKCCIYNFGQCSCQVNKIFLKSHFMPNIGTLGELELFFLFI